jgi:hypothetical protein
MSICNSRKEKDLKHKTRVMNRVLCYLSVLSSPG